MTHPAAKKSETRRRQSPAARPRPDGRARRRGGDRRGGRGRRDRRGGGGRACRRRRGGRRAAALARSSRAQKAGSPFPGAAGATPGDADTRLISLPGFQIKQALAKTITYRVIITACDLGWNYAILGDPASAAGLSAISLAAGPFSYFIHETGWNRFGPRIVKNGVVSVPLPALRQKSGAPQEKKPAIAVERSIAKTITFRTIGTVMEFSTNYAVVRDVTTAAWLSAFGFVLGPFIYLGHEKAWELATAPKPKAPAAPRFGRASAMKPCGSSR